tara:strand:- start:58531 stop:59526 length:996 start_codon:yes stop_codon:yes gene_type:complete
MPILRNDMRIAFPIIQTGTGSDHYYQLLTQGLKKRNIKSDIIKIPRRHEVTPWLSGKIKKQLSEYDLIHSNTEYAYLFHTENTPLVSTLHHDVFCENYYPFASLPQRLYYSLILRKNIERSITRSKVIICPSNTTKNQARKTYPQHKEKLITIHNGIINKNFKDSFNNKRNKKQLLFVGSAITRKGFDILPHLMNILESERFKLICVTPQPKNIKHKNIEFRPFITQPKLEKLYQESEFFISPTRLEGFGYAALEAALCGCKIITNNNTAIAEILSGYNKLFTTDENTAENIAETILLHQKNTIQKQCTIKKYNLEEMTEKYLAIYNEHKH